MQQREPLSRGWRRGAIKDGQVAHGLSYYYCGEARRLSRRLSGDSATIIDGGSENNNEERRLRYQDRTSISENSATAEDDLQKNEVYDELALIEKAFDYLTRKTYPPGCSKNDKRVIRRKAEKLEERNGEILYKKKGGNTVSVTDMCMA